MRVSGPPHRHDQPHRARLLHHGGGRLPRRPRGCVRQRRIQSVCPVLPEAKAASRRASGLWDFEMGRTLSWVSFHLDSSTPPQFASDMNPHLRIFEALCFGSQSVKCVPRPPKPKGCWSSASPQLVSRTPTGVSASRKS